MRTSEEIYHRIRWDPRFDPARFVMGVNVRGAAPKRVPLPSFVPGGDIPWHRVLFFEADGEVVWDRKAGRDDIDSSRAGRTREPRRLDAGGFTARAPFVWRPVDGWRAQEGDPSGRPSVSPGVRVLTWNTLWDRYDADRIDTARRRPLLLEALERADADVIALQEVEAGLLRPLLRTPWVRKSYTLGTDPSGPDVDDTGLLLLSRLPVLEAGVCALGPHKAVSAITVKAATGPIVVAVTHLTSDHTENGADRRGDEFGRLAGLVASVDGDVIVLGDFNDGGDAPARLLGMRDAWTEVRGPGDDTPTFDPVANPLAAVSSLSGRASRLDRVLLRGPGLRVSRASLLGNAPATPEGLLPSDHYGVVVDLDPTVNAPDPLGTARTTARTAVAWIPPEGLWPAIQEIRERHDPQIHRWPPHVNVLFGFVPEADFDEALPRLSRAVAKVAPFTAGLKGVQAFPHRDDFTVWLDPAADDPKPWAALRQELEKAFPQCRSRAEGYTPHLTLGRTRNADPLVTECETRLRGMSATVGELVVLSRRGTEPMRPRVAITLGTGEIRPLDHEPNTPGPQAPEDAGAVVRQLAEALPEAVLHVAGSRRMGCALPDADLDLVAVLPDSLAPPSPAGAEPQVTQAGARAATPSNANEPRPSSPPGTTTEPADIPRPGAEGAAAVLGPAEVEARVGSLPGVVGLRRVIGARVPGLRARVGGLDVDLLVVATGGVSPAEAVARRTELGEGAAVALSAVSDADAVLDFVGGGREDFVWLARAVKAWARARGLDTAPFGGLPGLAWAILAARTVREAPGLPPGELMARFFAGWAAWDWREPVGLGGGGAAEAVPVRIWTPSAPVRLCSEQVGVGMRDLLTQELYRAWEITEGGRSRWADLLAPPPLHRRHAAWAVVTVRRARSEELEVTVGRVRGRVRALLTALEDAGAVEAHAWPRPFDVGPDRVRFAVGLGRTPPDEATVVEAVRPWASGMRGVEVAWAECGEVPTLR
ncbi:poly(A) polymerase [Thermomonospora umbrina]|uniref:Endonuclease/exonuclease/phosphatase family protein n=1 Tax=Thermomonospora umbrina TaxID=111806 RepID=A0A3D9SIN0_9ACTN|nr:poly(A) polymerase [Thermomonospora umbrina]REE95788.1 endonuclease/exonuclease/phosphatase family protein [Thermomonospora umbrina]